MPALPRKSFALSQGVKTVVGRVKMRLGVGDGDLRRVLELLEGRVDEVGEAFEEREVGNGRDQAAGEDDVLAPDAIGERAEDEEERRADDEREPDQLIGVHEVELEVDEEEEQRVELAGVPDHALAGGGAEERERDVLVVRILEEAVADGRRGALAGGLHALKDRRFVQLEADVDGDRQERHRAPEGDPPAPVGEGGGFLQDAADADHHQGQQHADGGGGLDPAGGVAALVVRRVLGHVGRGAAVLAAQRQALREAQHHQEHRRREADGLEPGQEAHQDGGDAHHRDGDEEGVLASDEVADAAEDQRAEGADQEACRVRAEGAEQRRGHVTGGKEHAGEEGREDRVEVEVVPLEDGADRRGDDDQPLLGRKDCSLTGVDRGRFGSRAHASSWAG